MIVKANNVIGLPVYTVQHGKQLDNTVKDIVYDPYSNRVAALVLDDGGWFSHTKIILLQDVHSIGDDAVLIENEERIRQADEVKQKVASIAKGENYLTTDRVLTEDGTDLGKISDLYFDTATGNVEEFEVTQGVLKDAGTGKKTFKPNDIITIGDDAMIVGAYMDGRFDKQAQKKGITGTFNEAKHTTQKQAPSLLDQAKQTVQDVTQKTKEKVQQVKEHPKTQEMIQTSKEKAVQAKDVTSQKMQEGKDKVQDNRRNGAVGKYLTVNILSKNDQILAKRGEMVTHLLLEQAEKNGALEQVLSNTQNDPLQHSSLSSQQKPTTTSSQQTQPTDTKQEASRPEVNAVVVEEVVIPPLSEYRDQPVYGALGGKSQRPAKKSTKSGKNRK